MLCLHVKASMTSYVPLGYNNLRTTLLQRERAHIERQLQPTKDTWSLKGVTLMADG
ncbi:hypothetical protein AXF42_Ash004820 [Apostasia shenzhenica]|uniref:Uncharacterized protein n=1 Tax=Apostasia shenzhenica TaxID=1088818 RepID=A0A2I0B7T3_9ASPA|nr:hypothetical protein AXF42_Ash004820 [Apostasia shenzhenica]